MFNVTNLFSSTLKIHNTFILSWYIFQQQSSVFHWHLFEGRLSLFRLKAAQNVNIKFMYLWVSCVLLTNTYKPQQIEKCDISSCWEVTLLGWLNSSFWYFLYELALRCFWKSPHTSKRGVHTNARVAYFHLMIDRSPPHGEAYWFQERGGGAGTTDWQASRGRQRRRERCRRRRSERTSKRLNLKWKIERETDGRTLIRMERQRRRVGQSEW